MFTRSDLSTLLTADPALGISIFLPTHVLGSEVRQGPIRLKNLTAQARDDLVSTGLERAEAEAFLAPATALIEDYRFWQHQNHGLALFLDGGEPRCYRVPLPLAERVVVGPGFHVRPLLPVLEADGAFLVVTITADQVRLCEASRFALVEDDAADLPRSLDEVLGEADYQNPLQASPVARPNTGSISISQAQVYGDSPAEWRKGRLVEFGRADLDTLLSDREQVNTELRAVIDTPTEDWGISVDRVEVKDIALPEGMRRSMSRQAEAERDRRARVIAADGEFQASAKLSDAARAMSDTPGALQLRLLQTVADVASEKNSTLVMPFPVELLRFFENATGGQATDTTTTDTEPAQPGATDDRVLPSATSGALPEAGNGRGVAPSAELPGSAPE